jgi:hypothetical protein
LSRVKKYSFWPGVTLICIRLLNYLTHIWLDLHSSWTQNGPVTTNSNWPPNETAVINRRIINGQLNQSPSPPSRKSPRQRWTACAQRIPRYARESKFFQTITFPPPWTKSHDIFTIHCTATRQTKSSINLRSSKSINFAL